jgi:hypothetical protein
MTVRFLNTPSWSSAYTFAMLLSLAQSTITLEDGINIFTCGGEL